MQVRGRRPCVLSFGTRSIAKIEECWRQITRSERLTYIIDIFKGVHGALFSPGVHAVLDVIK
jgi:hypothetical protein